MATLQELVTRSRDRLGMETGSHTILCNAANPTDGDIIRINDVDILISATETNRASATLSTTHGTMAASLNTAINIIFNAESGISSTVDTATVTVVGARDIQVTQTNVAFTVALVDKTTDEPPTNSQLLKWVKQGQLDVANKVIDEIFVNDDAGSMVEHATLTLGTEEIPDTENRDFNTGSDWTNASANNDWDTYDEAATTGATEGSSGLFVDNYLKLIVTSDASNVKYATLDDAQFPSLVVGKTYRLSYSIEITAWTSGTLSVGFCNNSFALQSDINTYGATLAATTKHLDFVFDGTDYQSKIILHASTLSAFTVYFDNFTIKEALTELALPSNMLRPLFLSYQGGATDDTYSRAERLPIDMFLDAKNGESTYYPASTKESKWFSLYNSKIQVLPAAVATSDAYITYVIQPQTTAGTECSLPETLQESLVQYVCSSALESLGRADESAAYKQVYEQTLMFFNKRYTGTKDMKGEVE